MHTFTYPTVAEFLSLENMRDIERYEKIQEKNILILFYLH